MVKESTWSSQYIFEEFLLPKIDKFIFTISKNVTIDKLNKEEITHIYNIYFEENCKFNLFFYLKSVEYLKSLKKDFVIIYDFLKSAAISRLKEKRLICFEENNDSFLFFFIKEKKCLVYRVLKKEKADFLKSNNLDFLHIYYV